MPVDTYPLSPIQQGMLFHWLLDRHAGTDVEQIVADLYETIDPQRLERGWQHALVQFSTLRTAFIWEGSSTPLQRLEEHVSLDLAFEDLRALDPANRERRIEAYLRSDRRDGFDLSCAPAMRVALFQMAEAHFRMVWSFHHILIDGRSFEVILNEVFATYEGDRPRAVTDRPYRHYVDWIMQQDREAARGFWAENLRGFTATTPLPASHPPEGTEQRFGQRDAQLPIDVSRRLRELAEREDLSLNTLIMAAWALLLSRYSGEADIVFGATKTTRRGTIPDAPSMVGLFLATVPVRVTVDASMSVIDWLKHVRRQWTSLRGHEHLQLVDIKQASPLPSSAPLFETLVVFENYQFGTKLNGQGGNWANRRFRILEQTNYPLNLLAYGDEGVVLKIEYDARRFDKTTIDRMMGHLLTILGAWSEETAGPLWRVPMLTASERQTILGEWNNTTRSYPAETPLAALLEERADQAPDFPAVTCGAETLTYRELHFRANQMARALRELGIGPDVLVGVALDRSIAMMVALLAVMKAGGAYVPLDPLFPRERLAYMMEDSRMQVLITDRSLQASLPRFAGAVLAVDDGNWHAHSGEHLGLPTDPTSLAYVIYTSGSTGKPKGVLVPRGALTNLLWSMCDWLRLDASDRVLAVTTISFDIAAVDVWLPWLIGAHTILATREAAADGAQLRDLLERHDITFLQATPVTGRLLLAAGWQGKTNLQFVSTGEALPPDLAAELFPRTRRLWNLYGPTETTVWSTGDVVRDPTQPLLIGRPIANTRCYILDQHRQPVPVGVIGELYIGGDGVAKGYLNRPDLTEERFCPDPFVTKAGTRMYRTGDRARFLEDGRIECLGRTDFQIKIRGFRIEPGEIETLLRGHPGVTQAVVVAREDTPGDRRLVGYLACHGASLDLGELRKSLKGSLPDYMVPSALVCLDTMPLTANGKIDRHALPPPDSAKNLSSADVVFARTYVEQQLSEIWEELFGLTRVSVDADFFDLGGHSLLAVTLMARISRVFGKQLPLNTLFESPTIAQLAKHIEDSNRTVGRHSVVSIQASGSHPPIFWIPGGAALGLFSLRHLVTQLGPEQPVYGLGSSQPDSLEDVETVEDRARSYLELVHRVRPHGPYCLAGFCAGGLVAFEMAQRLVAQGETVPFLAMINCSFPRHPSRRVDRVSLRAQHLWHQLRAPRDPEFSFMAWARGKLASHRNARALREQLKITAREVKKSGFLGGASRHNLLVLEATVVEVFERYRPQAYPGSISLFVSDDADFAGVSRRLDPRIAWASYAAEHEVRRFPGGHLAIAEARYAGEFAQSLKSALERALETRSSG